MRPARRALALLLAAVVASPLTACSGGGEASGWDRMDDIDYLLAGDLPDGWVVSTATLRPGRPRSAWTYRADVYADPESDDFLVVGASVAPGERPARKGSPPGRPVPAEPEDFLYVWAYLGLHVEEGTPAEQIGFSSGSAGLQVAGIGRTAVDDGLLRKVAEQHADTADLDFGTPEAATDAGFRLVGTLTDTEDVPDYTLSWTHADHAGRARDEASEARKGAPSLWINVSSPMYARVLAGQRGTLPDDPDDAELETEGDGEGDGEEVSLAFLRDGIPVRVGGAGVDPEAVRALARSLRAVPFERWERELGERLLVDEPEARDP